MTFPAKKKILLGLLILVLALAGFIAYSYRTELTMRLVHRSPQPVRSVTAGQTTFSLQQLNTPELTSYDVDKILSFVFQDGIYYLAVRSQDGSTTMVEAFTEKDGSLYPYRTFGDKGTFTIPDKMVLSVTVSPTGDIVYVKKGIHTLKDGNDIISLKGTTTATRVAFLPGGQKAYLYGNDNFTLTEYKDGSFNNNKPAFLHNRAKPFAGGLTLVQVTPDGMIWGGGRPIPNGFSMIASFTPQGLPSKVYGSSNPVDKDSIYDLVDMAVIDHYIIAIDGFTLKLWNRDGKFLDSLNTSKVLGDNLNGSRLAVIDGKTIALLATVRNAQTRLVEIRIFLLTFS